MAQSPAKPNDACEETSCNATNMPLHRVYRKGSEQSSQWMDAMHSNNEWCPNLHDQEQRRFITNSGVQLNPTPTPSTLSDILSARLSILAPYPHQVTNAPNQYAKCHTNLPVLDRLDWQMQGKPTQLVEAAKEEDYKHDGEGAVNVSVNRKRFHNEDLDDDEAAVQSLWKKRKQTPRKSLTYHDDVLKAARRSDSETSTCQVACQDEDEISKIRSGLPQSSPLPQDVLCFGRLLKSFGLETVQGDPFEPRPIAPSTMLYPDGLRHAIRVSPTATWVESGSASRHHRVSKGAWIANSSSEPDRCRQHEEQVIAVISSSGSRCINGNEAKSCCYEPQNLVESTTESCRSIEFSIEGRMHSNAPRIPADDCKSKIWLERYCELVEYWKEHGHCNIPQRATSSSLLRRSSSEGNIDFEESARPSILAQWVKRQRYQYKLKERGGRSSLTREREEALNKIGFIWDSHSITWEDKLEELKAYRTEHGHCNVPTGYEENSQLAVWIKTQRRQYKLFLCGRRSAMTPSRIDKLNELRFDWKPRTSQAPKEPRTDVQGQNKRS